MRIVFCLKIYLHVISCCDQEQFVILLKNINKYKLSQKSLDYSKHMRYKQHDHALAKVTSAKYLGVPITEDLKWDSHINDTCSKPKRVLCFLRRFLNTKSVAIYQQSEFTLVRPLVEYASTV